MEKVKNNKAILIDLDRFDVSKEQKPFVVCFPGDASFTSHGANSLCKVVQKHTSKDQKTFGFFYPKKFELGAIAVDLFNGESNYDELKAYCNKLGVELTVVNSNINKIVFDIKKDPNPCSLCANLRRGFLNTTAKKMGFNKVALGHHADDLMETLFMSLFYESRFHLFLPKMQLTNNTLQVIRPMLLVYEKEIIGVSKDMPVIKNLCPADKHTQREYMKKLIQNLNKEIPGVQKNILSAIIHPERNYLFDKLNDI